MNESHLIWHAPEWQRQAHDWIRTQAQQRSIQLTGEIEQPHAYAWSTILRVASSEGMLYFKATAPETIYEIALTARLAVWFPDCLPNIIASDSTRGWMLMHDGGDQLRASIRPTKNVMPWEPVIVRYADLQIALAAHVDELLSLGLPDHRLSVLPALYSQLLTDEESLMIDKEKGLTSADFQTLQTLKPRFQQICADLAACGIPESANHGDFHDGNVLLKDGRITFFDWGDTSVTHPFVSLRTFFVSMEISLEMEDWALPTPEMLILRDRYLARWEGFASKEQLLKAYDLSRPVASIVKTLLWHEGITKMEPSVRQEYAWIVPEVLREFMVYEKMLND
jgi:aminoglycoside/choline kinase family phosphotransferase